MMRHLHQSIDRRPLHPRDILFPKKKHINQFFSYFVSLNLCRLTTPIFDDKVRFVCISDTHEKMSEILPLVPDGDVLIHAGDFTNYGDVGEVCKFNAELGNGLFFLHFWLNSSVVISAKLPHKYKIVIAGNHELGFEDGEKLNVQQLSGLNMLGIKKGYQLLTNCIYLCDREVDVSVLS